MPLSVCCYVVKSCLYFFTTWWSASTHKASMINSSPEVLCCDVLKAERSELKWVIVKQRHGSRLYHRTMLSCWLRFSTEGQMCSRWATVPSPPCMWPPSLGTTRWELFVLCECEQNAFYCFWTCNFLPTRQQIYSCSTAPSWMFRMLCFSRRCISLLITTTSR